MTKHRYSINIDAIARAVAHKVGMSASGLRTKIDRFLDSRGERSALTAIEKDLIGREVEAQEARSKENFDKVRKLLS